MMNDRNILAPPPFSISCQNCGDRISTSHWSWRHACGGTLRLDVAVDTARVEACRTGTCSRLDRFGPVLPLQHTPPTAIGDTPLLMEELSGVRIVFKLEHLNPGGSFKDRGAYVTVARCAELGFDSIVVDSSGNAGVAIALMALYLGIKVDVFLPRSTLSGKKQLLRTLGAVLHEVDGNRMRVHEEALACAATGPAYAGHWWNPYFAHGVKTIAYEVAGQIPHIDSVFAPVGAGTLLLGLHTGYLELLAAGAVTVMPRLVAVQAAGFSPVAAELGVFRHAGMVSRLADGIAITDPPRKHQIATAVNESGGLGTVVNDEEIEAAVRWLLARGYVVEPTSAVPVAGLMRCIADGRIRAGETVLIPLTGTGMKVLDELAKIRSRAARQ